LLNGIFLVRLFEHNNWANLQILQACSALSDEQLDAEPQSPKGVFAELQESVEMSALGVTPPDLDGWSYGEATNALIPIST